MSRPIWAFDRARNFVIVGSLLVGILIFLSFSADSWSGPFGSLLPLGCASIMVPLIAIGIASIYACLSSVAELVLNRNIDPDRKGLLQLAALGVPAYILCMIVIAVWRANLYPSEEVGSALSVAVQRYFITMFITPIFALPFVYAVKGIIAMPEVVKKGCLRIMLDIIVYESPAIWVILIVAYSSGDNNALVWLLVVGFITIPLWLVSLFLRALMS